MQDAVRNHRTASPVRVFESIWVPLDASQAAITYLSRTRPASAPGLPNLSPMTIKPPATVVCDRGSKFASLRLQLIVVVRVLFVLFA